MVVKLCFSKIWFVWICFSTLESLSIKDYFIRTFCKDKLGGFRGLKVYAMASEDRELEAKIAVVEKYSKRVPELVKRIYDRAQKSSVYAGGWDERFKSTVFQIYSMMACNPYIQSEYCYVSDCDRFYPWYGA